MKKKTKKPIVTQWHHDIMVELSSKGYSCKKIAYLLDIPEQTVRYHCSNEYAEIHPPVDWSKVKTGLGNIEYREKSISTAAEELLSGADEGLDYE